MKIRIFIIILVVLVTSFTATAYANLYGQSATLEDLRDYRTFSMSPAYDPHMSTGGLSGNWPYSFSISWDISYNLDSMLWQYKYNLSVNKKDISHFILELSPNARHDDFIDIHINGPSASMGEIKTWTKAGNQTLPQPFYGTKFDMGGHSITYSFETALDPVWGNFYAKGGVDKGEQINAYNNALNMADFNSSNKLDYIVRPNGGNPPVVPEPISSTLFVIGSMVMGCRLYIKKKQS